MPYNKKQYYYLEVFWKNKDPEKWRFDKPQLRSAALKTFKKNSFYHDCRVWESDK